MWFPKSAGLSWKKVAAEEATGEYDILEATNETWRRMVRGLLARAVRDGHLRPEMDSDDVAALIVATLSGLTLPTVARAAWTDQAVRQLERWLGTVAADREPGAHYSSN